jgi:GNAT superfamily N-acetyltransferase
MSSDVNFRSYETADAEVLPGLFIDALRTVYPDINSGAWTSDLDDIEAAYLEGGGDFIVGEHRYGILAMGGLRKVDSATVEMKRFAVNPLVFGQGLGQELLAVLEDKARELGFTRMVLDTTLAQEAARHIYEKNGYRLVDRKSVDHPSGQTFDTFFYQKELSKSGPIRPHRAKLAHAVAEIIKRGYTLTAPEVREIQTHYGYSHTTNPDDIMFSPRFKSIVTAKGGKLGFDYHNNRSIYLDISLPREETDIEATKAAINKRER